MLTQQDIYAAGSESRRPMLNKENYVPWSSRLLRYAKSRPNRKLIHNSILNGPYVKKMIPEPGDANREIIVTETFHLQTDDELSDKELKQIEADDQAIQTILLGLPEDIYAVENKAKLFNEWEWFTSNEGESIESYYHHFLKLMNDLKRNKHFPEKIASNLKFLNNLQPEWSQYVTIVHQTKDLHTANYTQLYDFLKYNQKEVDELKAKRLAKTQDPLALMTNSNNPYAFPAPHQDQSSFNQNYLQQPMPNPEDITDPTTTMNMALALMAKAFKLNYSTPTNYNQRISSNSRNKQIAQPGMNMGQDRQMQMVGGYSECCSESKGPVCPRLVEAARTMLILSRAPLFLWAEAIATACFTQNRSIINRRFNKTPYELINGRKPDISFLHVFDALCYPKNDREDIGKLGAKGDIGFFIGYSTDSCAYRIYNRRTKKIMETMNVSFDELSATAFKQRSSKPGLQSELDLLFEAMYDDYIGGQPSATGRTVPPAQEPQVRQTSTTSTTIVDTTPTLTNSSSLVTNILITSKDVDELNSNAMVDGNTFFNPFANSSTSAAASSSPQNVDPLNMHTFYQPYPHEFQWTKDHSQEQVIGEPSRPVLTRNQL
nr:hypothetical protein [Tanacetum cinerariifolium]GEY56132.1 hypothetical protein [Tanacetum cinerariifolium]GEY57221.1 hypothetical protein [Tanacetum cinerariifolium]